MVNRYVMKSDHDLFADCLPYEWRLGTSDGLFLPIYPPRGMHSSTLLRGLINFCNKYVIRPFCIMLLYRYLLHYGLLLHIMSQYLCLFSLILQGLHKEGECRQLGFWAGKGANIRDLFCTAPKVIKLHGSHF